MTQSKCYCKTTFIEKSLLYGNFYLIVTENKEKNKDKFQRKYRFILISI